MTREDYLDAVLQLIRSNNQSTAGLKASTLGNLILRSLPDHWTRHGYSALKDLLQELEHRGQVSIGLDAQKMLAIWVKGEHRGTRTKPIRLRREIWVAFVNQLPRGLRFMNRETGVVLMGQLALPMGDNEWIPIQPLSSDIQKNWAWEMISEFQLDDFRDTLADPLWYLSFPQQLRQSRRDMLTQWNRIRSTKILEAVQAWCTQHGIPIDLITEARPSTSDTDTEKATVLTNSTGDNTRQLLLDALARMPTQELLEIPIPGKYLFSDRQREST